MKLRFIIESKSNKRLDALTKEVILKSRQTSAVVLGPVCFKNKRLVDIYNYNARTIDYLTKIDNKLSIKCDVQITEHP